MAMVRVTVHGLGLDADHGPVVLLKELDGERVLPIWIGHPEAHAIQMKMEGQDYGRPLTHDLLRSVIASLGAQLVRVEITELKESTYFAELVLTSGENEVRIDARPSDSIALGLRCDSEIWVHESLFKHPESVQEADTDGNVEETEEQLAERQRAELQRRLRNTDPGDFGSYRLGD
jgi:hypothetical protein